MKKDAKQPTERLRSRDSRFSRNDINFKCQKYDESSVNNLVGNAVGPLRQSQYDVKDSQLTRAIRRSRINYLI